LTSDWTNATATAPSLVALVIVERLPRERPLERAVEACGRVVLVDPGAHELVRVSRVADHALVAQVHDRIDDVGVFRR
jgi:hypothetical protein